MLGGRRDSVGSISGRRDSVGSMLPRASDGASGGVKPRMRVAAGVGGASSRTPLLLPNARDFNAAGQQSSSGCRLYGRMALCFIGSMLSSGVLVSFPTLEPILLDQREGVVRTLVTRPLRCCSPLRASRAQCGGGTQGAALFAAHCEPGWADGSGSMPAFNSSSDPIYACPQQLQLAQTLYSVSLGLSTVATLLLGYIYDKRGPRFAGVLGAVLCAVCFALISVALQWPRLNGLVWLAVPLCDCAGARFQTHGIIITP